MITRVFDSVVEAAESLRAGGLLAFPTETVYGLGADARDSQAIRRLFAAKGRPADNPLIVHLARAADWPLAARELPASAERFLATFAPGPLTVVVPKHPSIAESVTAGLDSVGVRIPACEVARDLLALAEIPVAAPSANRSGRPSCTTWQAVLEDLDGRIDGVLKGAGSNIGIESTVVDCCGSRPVVLRPGGIQLSDLQQVEPSTIDLRRARELGGKYAQAVGDSPVPSPGLRHPHYRPNGRIWLIDSKAKVTFGFARDQRMGYAGMEPPDEASRFALLRIFASVEEYAAGFYEFLRECDRREVEHLVIQLAPSVGVGAALRERQERAAGAV